MSKSPSNSSAPLNRAAAPAALLETAFARHQSQLLGTLYHMLGNSDDAHDALQETFIKCWRKLFVDGKTAVVEEDAYGTLAGQFFV